MIKLQHIAHAPFWLPDEPGDILLTEVSLYQVLPTLVDDPEYQRHPYITVVDRNKLTEDHIGTFVIYGHSDTSIVQFIATPTVACELYFWPFTDTNHPIQLWPDGFSPDDPSAPVIMFHERSISPEAFMRLLGDRLTK